MEHLAGVEGTHPPCSCYVFINLLVIPGQPSNRPRSTPIHVLNNDSLLIIFSFCRPPLLDGDDVPDLRILQGGEWGRERWWYKLVHVCRRWRFLILQSAIYLRLRLVCTYGTPVADMLAHSPSLPLVIDYVDRYQEFSVEDEESITVALQHHDRVRRFRVRMPLLTLQRLIMIMENEFPMLEYLYIAPEKTDDSTRIPIVCNCHRSRHALARSYPPIRLLQSTRFTHATITHAPTRDTRDNLSLPCPKPCS